MLKKTPDRTLLALALAVATLLSSGARAQPREPLPTEAPSAAQGPAPESSSTPRYAPFVCLGSLSGVVIPARTVSSDPGAIDPTAGCQKDDRFASGVLQPTTAQSRSEEIQATLEMWILVRIRDRSDHTLRKLDPAEDDLEVTVRTGDKEIHRKLEQRDIVDSDGVVFGVALSTLSGAPNWSEISVEVSSSKLLGSTPQTSYFTLVNHWSPYGLAKSGTYFWMPVGLFATSFQATDSGIPFAAFPVSFALGTRYYWGTQSTRYLGLSLMANYAVVPVKDAAGTTTEVYFGGLGGGLLFDYSNLFYIGGAYTADFRSGRKDPGMSFVFGAGPGALQWLQGISN